MNKKILFGLATCSVLLLKGIYGNAQTSNHDQIAVLKNVVPPSPNSSSLGKYGEWPVALYTGVPNISVPVCELKGRTVSVPITLSYHASGNKVGDIPSWVGLGWSLNAGGAVTRSLRGGPDENGYFINAANHTSVNDYSTAAVNPVLEAQIIVSSATNGTDTQQDMYNFSALGKSYKFILKADGTMQTVPASAVKLIANPIFGANQTASTWTILLEDGTKLLFGGANYTETTSNPRFTQPDGSGLTFTSSWMLQSITTTSGEVLSFTYSPTNINQDSYYSQSDFIKYKTGGGCQPVTESAVTKTSIEKQDVISLNIATIESDLGRVEFISSSTTRQDLPGGKALQEIKLFSKTTNQYIEDYILTTSYTAASSSNVLTTPATLNDTYVNSRLRLNSFEKKDIANSAAPGQKWIFDYNPQNLPARRSFAQDHWGFFNGATSNTTLLPQVYFAVPLLWITNAAPFGFFPSLHDIGGNREGNANYIQAEMLTSIHYPTGGSTNFTFEPNSIPASEETFTKTSVGLALNMTANQTPPSNISTVLFTITKPQYISISANSFISPAILVDQPNAKTTTEIINPGGNSIGSIINTGSTWLNLVVAGTYTFKVSSNVLPAPNITGTNTINVNSILQYDQSNGVQNFNKLVGGLRINKIADFDGITANSINERSFVYELPLVINPVDIANDYLTKQAGIDGLSTPSCFDTTVTRNTSSRFSLGSIQGGTVAYSKVTTLYGLNGANGKTVSLFSNEADEINDPIFPSKVFPYPPADSKDHRRGLLLEETHYKSNLVTPLKKTTHTYSFNLIGYITGNKIGYISNYNTNGACLFTVVNSCGLRGAFVKTTCEQVKHLTSAEITYDNNGLNPLMVTSNYFYDNPNNMNAVRTETTDSRGNIIKSISRTPLEKADINAATPLTPTASAAIDTMLARNIIAPVLQQEHYKLNILQSRSLINYKNWTTTILQPENIQVQKTTNPLEIRIRFNAYDNLSNLSEQQKDNDVKQAYIYGYGKNYPVAQVIGADYTTIAALVTQTVLDNPLSTDAQIRTELNNLRTGLANTKALVSTYTYKPLVGITSQTDPNNKTTYYQYDAFNRLILIRDKDNNILKKICYNYAGQPENCSTCTNFSPNWQNTTTALRCQQGSCGNTGYQEQEQRDMNVCSPTYNQTKWINAGYSPTACPIVNCIALTSTNIAAGTGYTASYYNNATGITYNLPVSAATGLQPLGSIPEGTYTLTISTTGFQNFGTFYSGCGLKSQSGTSATFFSVPISSTGCLSIKIDMGGI
jgi:YD repeat-containing protein